MLCDLLEHVIEETEARRHMNRRFLIQINDDGDIGFLGSAPDLRTSRDRSQSFGNFRPGVEASSHSNTRDPEIGCQLEIGFAIADDKTRCAIESMLAQVVLE